MKKEKWYQKRLPDSLKIIHDIALIFSKVHKVESGEPPPVPLQRIVFASLVIPEFRFTQIIGKSLDRLEARPTNKPEHGWWVIAHDLWKVARKLAPLPYPALRKRHHLAVVTRRGNQWKEHKSEQYLTPCAKLVFAELCYRSGHTSWGISLQEAITKNSVYFPWAYGGIESLIDSLPLHKGMNGKLMQYGERQIRKALKELEQANRIKGIFRAYEGQGASKYWVFLTPEMSDLFTYLSNRLRALKAVADVQKQFKPKSMVHQHKRLAATKAALRKPAVSFEEKKAALKKQADFIKELHPKDWKTEKKPS